MYGHVTIIVTVPISAHARQSIIVYEKGSGSVGTRSRLATTHQKRFMEKRLHPDACNQKSEQVPKQKHVHDPNSRVVV